VSRRGSNTALAETTGKPELGVVGVRLGTPTSRVEFLGEFEGVAPPAAIPSLVDDPSLRIADVEGIAEKRHRRLSLLGAFFALRSAVARPWLAPITASGRASTTLAEKNRMYSSPKIRDLWKLFHDFRADFPRPDESDREVRNLCLAWKTKYKGGSPRALPRFFKKYPELAVWAVWVERAIHETPMRSAKNQFPRMDLLRRCLEVLVDIQVQHLADGKRRLDEPKNAS
jgi:hypothetical protein